jgi:tetratricopeptide (TPR) repeat protein
MPRRRAARDSDSKAGAPPPAAALPAALPPFRLRAALVVLAATLAYPLAESAWWSRPLWGAHALAFLPAAWWLLPVALAALFVPGVARKAGEWIERAMARAPRVWPWLAGLAATLVFWLVRERHLYWGDALPLSINVPAGQAFHEDEPLTLWLHHAVWSLGAGRWSAVAAIAAASAIAGGVWVALQARGFTRLGASAGTALLATLVLAAQGGAAIFHGHVENYAYLAVCLAAFLWAGIEYLDGRGPAWPAFGALLFGYAFHLLGALALPAAALLVAHGLRRPGKRAEMLITLAGAIALGAAAAWLARGLYAGGSPFAAFETGVRNVLQQPRDMQASAIFTLRRLADVWSHVVQVGPLSLVAALLLAVLLPVREVLRRPSGRFLALAAITLYAPALLLGEGNLGAARNWDLFAAPSLAIALFAVLAMLAVEPAAVRHRLLCAALAASLAQAVPWTALNLDRARTEARVAALPMTGGRSAAMLGTTALNAGDLPRAEQWFLRALAQDSLNLNALSGLGVARARLGKYVEAEAPMALAARLAPH